MKLMSFDEKYRNDLNEKAFIFNRTKENNFSILSKNSLSKHFQQILNANTLSFIDNFNE